MNVDLASLAPCEDQGTRCALPLTVGLAQSRDTPALELMAKDSPSPWLLLPACPVGSIGRLSWPTIKHEGHGPRLEN